MSNVMTRAQRIEHILNEHFQPSYLELKDVSSRHAGHLGARPEGQTHYELIIRSPRFFGMSRVQCHQAIFTLLDEEFRTGLHALAIDARADR